MRPLASESRREITQLRDLDLQLAFEGARALRENIENQLASIDDAEVQFLFEVARLRRTQGVIENRECRAGLFRAVANLGSLALPDERVRIGRLEFLADGIGNLGAGGLGQSFEFGERFFGRNFVARSEFDTDQDGAFDLYERLAMRTAQKKPLRECDPSSLSLSKFHPRLDCAVESFFLINSATES